jgi:NTF2 fold immunity protein
MLSRRWSGEKLITGSIALQIARLIHHQTYGQADLDANEPLGIRDEQDVWIVSGVKIVPIDPAGPVLDGPLEMRISKYDGQILSISSDSLSHSRSRRKRKPWVGCDK